MPFIYKITNMITGKAYVGKTMHSVEKRWKEHCKDRLRRRCEKRPLYDAMNKYGIENFTVETLEECSPETVTEREEYWIRVLGTFQHGYNATIGGDSRHYIDYDTVFEVFCLTDSTHITAEILSIDESQCRHILSLYGVKPLPRSQTSFRGHSKRVSMYSLSGEYIRTFDSMAAAALFIDPSADKKTKHSIVSHISDICRKKGTTAYGYKWEYMVPDHFADEDW